ncbi:hypothetical protein GCM10023235_78160 [Kitasatospora terrestris]|uniref:Uncharacterized protein n=1 Tax=Kitasatospora terrestris TaxID=258051 RepID=A0ABP9ETE3_9ACTN
MDRSDPAAVRWTVTTDPNRVFEAASDQGVRVRAQAVLPACFEADLAQGSASPGPRWRLHHLTGRPVHLPAQLALTHDEREPAPSPWDPDHADLARLDYAA